MANQVSSRREFLRDTVLTTALAGMMTGAAQAGAGRLHVACNQYPWGTFYAREKKDFNLRCSIRDWRRSRPAAMMDSSREWGGCNKSNRWRRC